MRSDKAISFLRWALPRMGYTWDGYRKPRNQVLKRIRNRMQKLELHGGYTDYQKYLKEHPDEWKVLDGLCNVTISKFFRDRKVWEFLRRRVLNDLLRNLGSDTLKIWSAGCCNGEEAYGIAILFEQPADYRPAGKQIEILATDRSEDVLDRARSGRYPAGALKELTGDEIKTFFHQTEAGNTDEEYEIDDRLRPYIEFDKRDIRRSLPDRKFELVLCRNLVFTYFDEKHQREFLKRLRPHLEPDSYLVIGCNEEMPETEWLERVSGTHPVLSRKETG